MTPNDPQWATTTPIRDIYALNLIFFDTQNIPSTIRFVKAFNIISSHYLSLSMLFIHSFNHLYIDSYFLIPRWWPYRMRLFHYLERLVRSLAYLPFFVHLSVISKIGGPYILYVTFFSLCPESVIKLVFCWGSLWVIGAYCGSLRLFGDSWGSLCLIEGCSTV